ncbi:MAG: trimeric intracellular cation channel family protein [Spirochaetia bacterium]|nr:trimeric intracellular cation channel family protein [Spirochaetota bacterium]MCX8097022.1 trimeric intracellular cation channel family protein [Spirochaetota bacterium]MDW8111895.1 trimeric intracellular cation channel family protein [Spirochaetia bacterium]
MNILYVFDLFGTMVFSSTGAIRGLEKKLDLFGIFVVSFLTAVGGGTIRDIIINRIPFYFYDLNYTFAILLGILIVVVFRKFVEKYKSILVYLDALGLGVFSIIGAERGLNANLPDIGVVIVGLITGIGGGILRDILVKEVPFVLEKEIYATASIVGLVLFLLFVKTSIFPFVVSVWICIGVIVMIRITSYLLNLNLPRF